MVRRLAAAEVIVVHGGEIIVDERHGVQHLHRARGGHGLRDVPSHGLARRQTEARPHALAARQQRVPARQPPSRVKGFDRPCLQP